MHQFERVIVDYYLPRSVSPAAMFGCASPARDDTEHPNTLGSGGSKKGASMVESPVDGGRSHLVLGLDAPLPHRP